MHKIVIVGAGSAGCSCAISLRSKGFEVVLIDNSNEGECKNGERIPSTMNALFRQLEIYGSFLEQQHEPCYGSCSYWGSTSREYSDTVLSPDGHGWHLDSTKFARFFRNETTRRGATILSDSTFISSEKIQDQHRVYFKTKANTIKYIDADFVVDASGSSSAFAAVQNSKKIKGQGLIRLETEFERTTDKNISKLTFLEAVPEGWWYVTRISDIKLMVTFFTLPEIVQDLKLNELANWLSVAEKAPAISKLISEMRPTEAKVKQFTTQSFCLNKVAGDHWLAIGDAASTYDPISAQGITKSVREGIRASEVISGHFSGSKSALKTFEAKLQQQFIEYKKARTYFYDLEKRWVTSIFWKTLQEKKSIYSFRKSIRAKVASGGTAFEW